MKHSLKQMLDVIRTIHCGSIKKPITKISGITEKDITERNKCIFVISDSDDYKIIDVYFPYKSDMFYHTVYRFNENTGIEDRDFEIDVNVVPPKEVFQRAYMSNNVYTGEIYKPFFMKGHSHKAPAKKCKFVCPEKMF